LVYHTPSRKALSHYCGLPILSGKLARSNDSENVTEEVYALVTEKAPETSTVVAFSDTKVATTFPLREGYNAEHFL
jgi:hypothetical protein